MVMDSSIIRLPYPFTIRTHNRSPSSSFISVSHHYRKLFKLERTSRCSSSSIGSGRDGVVFDEGAFEAERLSLDAKARESMAEASKRVMEEEEDSSGNKDPKAWKWRIRKRVWDLMEALNIAQNPRPVHHRIPNFVGAAAAADKLGGLEVFQMAKCVKVNPDSLQKQVRFLTLSGGKKLLTPQPRLRTGFFSVLESHVLTPQTINEACTSVGVAKYGRPIGLDESSRWI